MGFRATRLRIQMMEIIPFEPMEGRRTDPAFPLLITARMAIPRRTSPPSE